MNSINQVVAIETTDSTLSEMEVVHMTIQEKNKNLNLNTVSDNFNTKLPDFRKQIVIL